MNIDLSTGTIRELLYRAADMVTEYYCDEDNRRIFPETASGEIAALFLEPLPEEPTDPEVLLDEVQKKIIRNSCHSISPNFHALVTSQGNPIGIAGALLAAGLNQVVLKEAIAPAATHVERQVLRWIAEFIGYFRDSDGILVSGGSMANLVALAAARNATGNSDIARQGLGGSRRLTVYASTETHHCIAKAMNLLGLGVDNLRSVPTDDRFMIDLDAMGERVAADRRAGYTPFCVVGNAGTVNVGAVDPLNRLSDFCQLEGLWFHVDAAYGGPAGATSAAREYFHGIERADSIAIDPHKWLHVPFEVGCVLVHDGRFLADTFGHSGAYAESPGEPTSFVNFMDRGIQMSRDFKALKVWMTLKGYGAKLLRDSIQENIATMRHLGRLVDSGDDFERLAPVTLSIVCFRYVRTGCRGNEPYLEWINQRLLEALGKDGRVFVMGTRINGRTALRACCVKFRTKVEHVEYLLEVLKEIGSRIHSEERAPAK